MGFSYYGVSQSLLALFSELSGLFHQVHQSGKHRDVSWLKTHLLDLRIISKVSQMTQCAQYNFVKVCVLISFVYICFCQRNLHLIVTCAYPSPHVSACVYAPVTRHLPVPPGTPHPVPAEGGSCYRLWVRRLLLLW